VTALWKESLSKISEKAAQSLADPVQYENLFPDYGDSLKAEQFMQAEKRQIPASASSSIPVRILITPITKDTFSYF